jgi:hypothetical protein
VSNPLPPSAALPLMSGRIGIVETKLILPLIEGETRA